MNKQNKNGKEQAETLKLGIGMKVIEMDKSGYDEPDMVSDRSDQDDPLANANHYKSWWNQFRGHWLQSENMTVEEIKFKADDAWECGDYKEVKNLMAELICRLEKN